MRKAFIVFALGAACVCAVSFWALSGRRDSRADMMSDPGTKLVLPPDMRTCDPDAASAGYISEEQHRGLVHIFDEQPEASPFDALSASQRSIVAAALQMGFSRAFYSARILRTAEMVRQLDLQQSCMIDSACKSDDYSLVDHLKTGAADDPNREVSWQKLRQDWRGYLVEDIDLARRCFLY